MPPTIEGKQGAVDALKERSTWWRPSINNIINATEYSFSQDSTSVLSPPRTILAPDVVQMETLHGVRPYSQETMLNNVDDGLLSRLEEVLITGNITLPTIAVENSQSLGKVAREREGINTIAAVTGEPYLEAENATKMLLPFPPVSQLMVASNTSNLEARARMRVVEGSSRRNGQDEGPQKSSGYFEERSQ
ncbi:MAG: hypothetical protein M1825_001303 [Sarcosagium campestre]|nr:MAG: hypothetical protein M1825_001303 [Sarcosagium campestre]